MEQLLDLDAFARSLTEKGYDGYFLTQGGYPDQLKNSINKFLEACKQGTDKLYYPDLLPIQTYLEWNGEDKPRVSCHMWLAHQNTKFDVRKMVIEKTDQFGQLVKKSELTGLSTRMIPTRKEALGLVSDMPKQKLPFKGRKLKMK